jgi:hypothetical protein
MADDPKQEANLIEQDVLRTQDDIGETVEKLEEKLTPRELTRSVIGDDGAEVAREALEVARQNPIPVAMIAVGLIWLLATSRSPTLKRLTGRVLGGGSAAEEDQSGLRPRSAEPAPIGPPGAVGEDYDRMGMETGQL